MYSVFSRRDFLKIIGVGASAVVLNGCASKGFVPAQAPFATGVPTITPSPPASPTATRLPRGSATPTMTPDPRKLCFVLWDHQLARYDFKPRNLKMALPETCPLFSGAINPMTPAWVAYWKGILHLCNPDVSPKRFDGAWESLILSNRAFTNGTGPDTDNFALHSLTCGGATHEMVTGIPEGDHMRIYTLNSRKDPPSIPTKIDDIDITRHFFATSGSNVLLADGSYAVYGFPQFENCIVPLVSPNDTDLIDISRIKVVTNIQRPYNT
jgi:hypothetical protein